MPSRAVLTLALALAALLPACTLGPDYVRPETNTPPAWTISYEEAAGLLDVAWWELFDDPALDEIIDLGIRGNLDLKAATARVEQFTGQWRTTRSELFPQFDARIASSRNKASETGAPPGSENAYSLHSGDLGVFWEIDLWGRIHRSSEAAMADTLASEAGRRGVLLTLVSDLAGAYILLRGLDSQLEIARETERNYFETLRLFTLRHDYGTVSQVELSQIESLYEEARQTVPAIEARVMRAEHLLRLLLGRPPGPVPRGRAIEELAGPGIPAGLPSELLEQRPDIILAEQQLIAANARIGAAKALYFPRISLTGLLGTASTDLGDLLESRSTVWQIGGEALAPIYTFGGIEGQVMTAEATQREALALYRQSILSALREVSDALASTVKGRESLTARGKRVDALSRYARLAWLQYDSGAAGYLQVLDANRSLFAGRLDYVQDRIDVLTSLVDVYRAMGGGWLDVADNRDPNIDPDGTRHPELPDPNWPF